MSVPADQMPDMMPQQPMVQYEQEEPEQKSKLDKYLDQENIIDELQDKNKAAADTLDLYNDAKVSMEKWLKKYKRALNLAKLQAMSGDQEIDSKDFPFEGASVVMMPFILEAMLDFSSRVTPELVWADNIVSAKVYGKETQEKLDRAQRVSDYMNYQLTEGIEGWRDNQDKGMMILPAIGTFYKKTCYEYSEQEIDSDLKLADEVIFDHTYKCFDEAPDKFVPCRYSRNYVISYIRGEEGWDIDESELEEDKNDFEFIEAYTWFDLDDDGLKEPYVAVLWEEKEKIVALYPNYDEDTITLNDKNEVIKVEPLEVFTQYRFLPDPEGGPMGMGWGILLGPMFDAINTNVRQLIDSGTLANTAANSGLISQSNVSGRGNASQAGPIEVVMGQLTPIPHHGQGSLRDNVVQFPFAGPNPTLFQLMEYLIQSARSMTNATVNAQASPGEAAAMYLAKLQQGLKIPNSIVMRVYNCAKREMNIIANLNYKHYDDKKYNRVLDLDQQASMEKDFDSDDCDIRMVADPTQGSDIERIHRAQAIYSMAITDQNQSINAYEATIGLLKSLKTPDIEVIAPKPDPNAVSPDMKLMLAERQMEAEMKKQDQMLRAGELKVKATKAALDAAKAQAELGLDTDFKEAQITQMYTQALKNLVEAGVAVGSGAIDEMKRLEQMFIPQGDMNVGQIPENNTGTMGTMGSEPGNQNVPAMPPMGGGAVGGSTPSAG